MAAKGARVHIYGDWDGSGVKKAQKDLSGFQKQAGGFTNAVSKSFLGMGAAIGGAMALGSIVSFAKDYAGAAIEMAQESQKTTDRIEAIAKSMGVFDSQLGGTTKRLTDYAQQLQNTTGISDETTKSGQAILLTFAELANTAGEAGGMFDRATAALLDLSAAGFGDATTNAKSLGKALNDPLKGLTALGRQGITFTEQEKEKVKALVATNRTLEAQELIMAAVEKQVGGTAAATATDFDKIRAAADDAQEVIGFALVDSIGKVVTAFGGVDDVNIAMTSLGDSIAGMVETAGTMLADVAEVVGALARWRSETEGVDEATEQADYTLAAWLQLIPVAGSYLSMWAQGAAEANLYQEQLNESTKASEGYWASYIASVDGAAAAQRQLEQDTEDAEDALKALRDEVRTLRGALSTNQSVDDFAASLRDLDDTLEGNKRTFKGMSDSALENREVLRTAFSDAAGIVQGFVDEGRISESEFADVFAGTGKKIVDDLVAQGFKKKDIKAFLKAEGLWTSELAAVFSAPNNREALTESERLGYDIASGISVGVSNGTPKVKSAVSGTVLAAIQAGEKAGKIQSPSKETRDKIGIPLIDGVIAGMKVKKEDLESTSQSLISDAIGVIKAELQDFDDKIKDALDANNDAKKAIEDWAASTRDTLVSAFDLSAVFEGSYDEEGNFVASKFFGGMDAAIAKFEWYNNVLQKIKASGGSDQLVAFLQQQGVDKGGVWGQSLIDNGLVDYMNQNLTKVTGVADTTAQATVPAFLLAAQENSAALYNQMVADYGKDGEKRKALEKLMDRLSKALNRTSTITIETVYKATGLDGKRAAGGPVSANKAYLVGERGPEVLVMGGQSGTIIPNGDLPMASGGVRGGDGATLGGNSYSITVQAGVGDPRQIGQQVVEYIKKFEKASGPVFAAAG